MAEMEWLMVDGLRLIVNGHLQVFSSKLTLGRISSSQTCPLVRLNN
jgi:hypothetical protein